MNPTHREYLHDSHLFLVRVWAVEQTGEKSWHGKVQHVASGEAHAFDGWPTLIDPLLTMLPGLLPPGGEKCGEKEADKEY